MRSNTIAGANSIHYFYPLIRHQNIYMRTFQISTRPAIANLLADTPAQTARELSGENKNAQGGIIFRSKSHQKLNAANYPDRLKVGINFANISAGNSYALTNLISKNTNPGCCSVNLL